MGGWWNADRMQHALSKTCVHAQRGSAHRCMNAVHEARYSQAPSGRTVVVDGNKEKRKGGRSMHARSAGREGMRCAAIDGKNGLGGG